jgi:hypothetical protein
MGIRDSNIDPVYSQFARMVTVLPLRAVSTSIQVAGQLVAPFKAKLLSARFVANSVTGSVPIDVRIGVTSIVSTTIDASTSVSAFVLTDTVVEEGDVINVTGTTGSGEDVDGALTLEWRPFLGSQERVTEGFGDF